MGMKTLVRFTATMLLMILAGCRSEDSDRRQTPGEAAGHVAYEVEKGTKKAAKELSKDLKSFSHDAKEGFQDAKQKDIERKKVERDEK